MCGSAPKPQAPAAPVAPPPVPNAKANKAEILAASGKEKQKAAAAVGQDKTILTTALGVQEDPNVKKKTLLGQ